MAHEELKRPPVNTLFKNQGVYNGLIAVRLLLSRFFAETPLEMSRFLLILIVLVVLYDSLTSNKKGMVTQGSLTIIAIIVTIFY